ncbi:MAG: hypothetical protein OZ921_02370 [Sorangiineae bacterium]|nr:hypothetical protein [Polyangiaceae bacterium]MEB2321330.1 hypothetical protein [Sorangiineae bacterium]
MSLGIRRSLAFAAVLAAGGAGAAAQLGSASARSAAPDPSSGARGARSARAAPLSMPEPATPSASATPAAPDPPAPEAPALPPGLTARAVDTPDLTQTDAALGLPGNGNSYCGPVAVSNSLMWLAANGYPLLAPDGETPREQQVELVRLISSQKYMATGPRSGTGPMGLMHGLDRYVRRAGYVVTRLEYEGWRQHPYEFTRHEPHPNLEWIASGLGPRGAAFVHVGWYAPSPHAEAYRRKGGHWLSVVAAGKDEAGSDAPDVLVLHDPAPYQDGGPKSVFARARRIEGGWMLDGKAAFPAKGYYELTGGMALKEAGEVAIIDGAVVLELAPPS